MKIACIGWASLIWDPRDLLVETSWRSSGPFVPIEFTRISNNGRVTLIIDSDANTKRVQTLWSLMTTSDLDEAKESLRKREGTTMNNIHFLTSKEKSEDEIKLIVKEWMLSNEIEAAIWTGLSYSEQTGKKRPSLERIIDHLKNLKDDSRDFAEDYVRRTPKRIQTIYRSKIEMELGWTPIELVL